MSYRFSRDPETVRVLRGILADPSMLGPAARTASDEQIVKAAEGFANTTMAAATKLGLELRRLGAQMVEAFGPLAKSAERFRRENPGAYERLMRRAK